jgi:ribosomal protein L31E
MAGDGAKKEKKRTKEVVAREYTINLHKALHGTTFKKRAPKAIKVVRTPPSLALALPEHTSGLRAVVARCQLSPGRWVAALLRVWRPTLGPDTVFWSAAAQVKAFAQKAMKTKEVRVDTELNKQLWSNGIRNVRTRPADNPSTLSASSLQTPCSAHGSHTDASLHSATSQVPRRVRVKISRKRNDDDDAKVRCQGSAIHASHHLLTASSLRRRSSSALLSSLTLVATSTTWARRRLNRPPSERNATQLQQRATRAAGTHARELHEIKLQEGVSRAPVAGIEANI